MNKSLDMMNERSYKEWKKTIGKNVYRSKRLFEKYKETEKLQTDKDALNLHKHINE